MNTSESINELGKDYASKEELVEYEDIDPRELGINIPEEQEILPGLEEPKDELSEWLEEQKRIGKEARKELRKKLDDVEYEQFLQIPIYPVKQVKSNQQSINQDEYENYDQYESSYILEDDLYGSYWCCSS